MIAWLKQKLDAIGSPSLDWIQVETTTHCNSDCIYCPHTIQHSLWEKRHMSIELFDRIVPYLKYTDLIYLQGWGEPLLNPHIFELIETGKKLGKRVGFTTNGMLLTEKSIGKLLDLGLDIISISLAGATALTHNRIRRGTDFEKIITNLKRLSRIKSEKKSTKPAVHLSYLMLKSNVHELKKIISLARKIAADQVVASHPALLLDSRISEQALFNHPDRAAAWRILLEEIKTRAASENIVFAYRDPEPDLDFKSCTENVAQACVLSVGGEICPCVYTNPSLIGKTPSNQTPALYHLFQGQAVPLKPVSFGHIKTRSLTKIWNLKEYVDFRACFNPERMEAGPEVRPDLPACCVTCYKRLGL